jgi:hypothetical protein
MKKFIGLTIIAVGLAGCNAGTIRDQLAANSAAAVTVTCAINSAVVIGVAVDSAIDTTKAAASTNAKITGASNALCSGISSAAKQIAAGQP